MNEHELNLRLKLYKKWENEEHIPTWARKIFKRKHDSALYKIVQNPSLINLKGNYSADIEVPFYNENKEQIGKVDILFQNTEIAYFIEYKTNDTPKNRKRAKEQLLNIEKHLLPEFPQKEKVLLYVTKSLIPLKLTGEGWTKYSLKTQKQSL